MCLNNYFIFAVFQFLKAITTFILGCCSDSEPFILCITFTGSAEPLDFSKCSGPFARGSRYSVKESSTWP